MSYYYWHSNKMAQQIAQDPMTQSTGDKGYGICVDGQNKCHQYMMITQQNHDDKQRGGRYPDLHIVATGRDRDDVKNLVSPVGHVNKELADELGFDTSLPQADLLKQIAAKTENFVDPVDAKPQLSVAAAVKNTPKNNGFGR